MWLWVGRKNGTDFMFPIAAVVLLSFMYYVQEIRDVVLAYKTAAGMWYADRMKPYVTALVNAVLDIVLFPFLGVVGVILSTVLARALIGLPWETNAMFKLYFRQSQKPYYGSMLKYFLITVCIGTVCFFICSLLPDGSILLFLVKAVVCSVISASLYLLVYFKNPYMKKIIKGVSYVLKLSRRQ